MHSHGGPWERGKPAREGAPVTWPLLTGNSVKPSTFSAGKDSDQPECVPSLVQKSANTHTATPPRSHAPRGNAYRSLPDMKQSVYARNYESLMGG